MWLVMLGVGLCGTSVLMLLGMMAVIILDGEQKIQVAWVPGAERPAEPSYRERRHRYTASGRPEVLGPMVLLLLFAGFCATVVWLATYGATTLGLGTAVDAAVVALKR